MIPNVRRPDPSVENHAITDETGIAKLYWSGEIQSYQLPSQSSLNPSAVATKLLGITAVRKGRGRGEFRIEDGQRASDKERREFFEEFRRLSNRTNIDKPQRFTSDPALPREVEITLVPFKPFTVRLLGSDGEPIAGRGLSLIHISEPTRPY